ncbi:MAG: copper amine oxidase N-terminal domain-containing protein [Firmicutes bacterium]|nr:copper amine oxidase N-terminal domain-containing protein [Bacillota bacterium]
MRRCTAILLLVLLTAPFCGSGARAAGAGDVRIEIDGVPLQTEAPAFIEQNRTFVPFRSIFTSLGAEVSWDGPTRTVTGRLGDTTIQLVIGNKTALVNGTPVVCDVAPMIRGDRTYVPARFVTETLGMTVTWDPGSRIVSIRKGPGARTGVISFREYSFLDSEGLGVEGFRMLLPADWHLSGGIQWRKERPLLPASLALRVSAPDAAESLECFPDEAYFWIEAQGLWIPYDYGPQMRAQMAMSYQGYEARRPMDAASYITGVLIPRYRGDVSSLSVVKTVSLNDTPAVVQLRDALARRPAGPLPERVVVDAAQVRVSYREAGRDMEEDFWAVVVTDTYGTTAELETTTGVRMSSTFWYADGLWSLRAWKEGVSSESDKVLMTAMRSFRWNRQWLERYAQLLDTIWRRVLEGVMARTEIVTRTQNEVARTVQSTFENQEAAMDRIAERWSETIRGVEHYTDPSPGLASFSQHGDSATVELPNGYEYAWSNGQGQYLLTNNPNFNPNVEFQTSAWTQMAKVR